MKSALITGISGQDASYLAELLLGKGYRVAGIVRDSGLADFSRIRAIRDRVEIFDADLLDQDILERVLRQCQPQEVYNLAAHSFLAHSFADPVMAGEYIGLGVTRLLEAIRTVDPSIRFFQASSSEMFGNSVESPQNESTPIRPRNPYGVAKAYGYWITVNYREHHRLFACSAILYNHESPRRSPEFVTRKITQTAAKIKLGLARELRIGNLEARRDWGFAGDYVRAMWLMLQRDRAEDFVLATGRTHSVEDFCRTAFSCVGLNFEDYLVHESEPNRPPESVQLVGNPDKARRLLGWSPTVSFHDLVKMMVEADLEILQSTRKGDAAK